MPDAAASGSAVPGTEITYEVLWRDRAVRDGAALVGLGRDLAWENWTIENLLIDLPSKWELSFVAVSSAGPVGYGVASRKPDAVHLHHLIVGPAWRGSGVGRELLRRVTAGALAVGARDVSLKVHRDNVRAIAFYERLGFRLDPGSHGDWAPMTGAVDEILRRIVS